MIKISDIPTVAEKVLSTDKEREKITMLIRKGDREGALSYLLHKLDVCYLGGGIRKKDAVPLYSLLGVAPADIAEPTRQKRTR